MTAPSTLAVVLTAAMFPLLLSPSGCWNARDRESATDQPASTQARLTMQDAVTAAAAVGGSTGPVKKVWVVMKQQANMGPAAGRSASAARDWRTKGRDVVDMLTRTAAGSQADIVATLQARRAKHKPFWIVNAIAVTADQATIDELGKRSDVAQILPDRTFSLPPLTRGSAPAAATSPAGAEWGLENIRATDVWEQFGAKGAGVVVASIDSGVQYDHPALVRQYRGNLGNGTFDHNYNWFDPTRICGEPTAPPCDNYSHGTHTMGTMVGDDGAGNQIGVAPAARWIAAKGCESNVCSTESVLAAGQWILAPTDVDGMNPRPELRPHIVNNSWGGPGGDFFFRSIVQAWVAAGIFPVFSNGNDGPYCYSAGSPGDYPESYAVGAYDMSNALADFSSRGPGFDGSIKPNIAAPGVDIRSSVPGSAYAVHSGTSMAAPHVAGSVALIWSAAPVLLGDVEATRELLDRTAIDTAAIDCGGTATNNGSFGEGRIDTLQAVAQAPVGPAGILRGAITAPDAAPIAGAQVSVTGPSGRSTTTNAAGAYSLRLLEGTYDLRVAAFGFLQGAVASVTVTKDVATEQNVALASAPAHAVSGAVRTADGLAVPGAKVTIVGAPIPPAMVDRAGRYSFPSVPEGKYDLSATSDDGCLDSAAGHVVVGASDVTADIALPRRSDGFGYFCRQEAFAYVAADDVLPISGTGTQVDVPLPFTFNLYGRDYTSVNVTSAGLLGFLPMASVPFDNFASIPSPGDPDAAVFPFWDALDIGPDASVRTKTTGSAPHRQFVVEWRGATASGDPNVNVTFEVILSENGEIRMAYASAEGSDAGRGGSATIGLEDETGTTGFQYAFNQPVLRSGLSVRYSFPPSGIVSGVVTSLNTGAPVAGAEIRALQGGALDRSTKTNAEGRYSMRLVPGTHTIEAEAANYAVAHATVSVAADARSTRDLRLASGRPVLSPSTVQLTMLPSQVRTRTLTLSNTGSAPLQFEALESGGLRQTVIGTARLPKSPSVDRAAKNTRGLFAGGVAVSGAKATAVGDVLRSFTPERVGGVWGLGYTGKVWLNDVNARQDVEFTTAGAPTGVLWPTPWFADGSADMTYDRGRNLLCHVNLGGDNGIYCSDPATGNLVSTIAGRFPWTVSSQRGLAYRADDDSFYVGGWNDGTVYHIRGLGAASPGEVIGSCRPNDGTISGLAYNGSMGVLWVGTNTDTDTIYALNPDDCTVLSTLAHPAPGYNSGGLEMDEVGNLWMIAQLPPQVYLVESGVAAFSDVPWLSVTPATGTLAVGAKTKVSVKVDTSGLSPGLYLASVFMRSDPAAERLLQVPVSVLVTDYQQGVNAGGNAHVDLEGDSWAADKPFVAGSWGYTQRGKTASTTRTIDRTSNQALYSSQRIDPSTYSFDHLPNGAYRLELGFAEIQNARAGARVFDVAIEGSVVLAGHDVAAAVGPYTAESMTFVVDVADGRLDVRLSPRGPCLPPTVSLLRATHLTDR
jgi:subtilisin family serine protease